MFGIFQMDGFFSLSPSSKWTTPTWFMHDIEKTASITEHITVVLAIPYTTTMGERGCGDNHTHSSTYHRQTSLYFPCNTRHSLFIKQWEQLRLKWKEPIHNRGDSLYIEITCACSIGNKVLVIGNTNVRFLFTLMARLRHCISSPCQPLMITIMPWARQHRGVAVRHGSTSSSLNPNSK